MPDVSSNKRIAKNTLLLYVRQLLTLFLALYTSRLTLQVLGVTDFGIYFAVGGVTAFLIILTSSLSSSSQRFLTFSLGNGDANRLNQIYITSVNIHILLSFVLIVIAETIGLWFLYNKMVIPVERLPVAFWVYQLSVLSAIVYVLNAPNNAVIIAHEDMGTFALFSILDAVLKFGGVIYLFFISWDKLLAYAIMLFLMQTINPIVAFIYCRIKYVECKYKLLMDKALFKSMVGLASWNMLSSLAIMGFVQGTNILLNLFFGLGLNSAYAVASQAYSGVRSFTSNFQLASNPQIVKLYSKGETEEMHTLLMRVCKYSFYLIFVISFPFILNAHTVLALWLKNVPAHSETFFVLLLIFAYIDVMAYPLDIAAQATGNLKKYSIYVSCCIISTLPLSYVCFKLGAIPETILIIALIVSFIGISIRLKLLSRMIGLSTQQFIKTVLLRPLLFVSIISIIVIPIKNVIVINDIFSSCLYFIFIVIVEISIFYAIGLDSSEKRLIKKLFFNILKHIK